MILAAGFGTRLGSLTQDRPKPMLPVCGTPLVRWGLLWLRSQGIREFVINLHHLGGQIEAELGDGSTLGVAIAYSHEEGQILGTGGGLRQARHLLDDGRDLPIVVVNGKLLLELDLARVLAFHRERGAEATMVLRPDPKMERWGEPLHVDDRGRVVSMLGEVVPEANAGEPLMFSGVHVFQPRFLDRIPPEGEQCVIRTAYMALLREGSGLAGFVTRQYWWDHSTTERYLEGVCNVLDGHVALPYAEHPLRGVDSTAKIAEGATIEDPVWIGPGVHVGEGAHVGPHVQLGRGARVEPGRRLRRAIVWDGARVTRDQEDEVFTS
jgi:NDP-sugar pyrophosphorylase family protein